MPRYNWIAKHNISLKQKVTGIYWNGVEIPFGPRQLELFEMLLLGGIPSYSPIRNRRSTAVAISIMRSILADIGFPLTIKNIQGTSDRSYVLVEVKPSSELGVLEEDKKGGTDGRPDAACSGLSGLQGHTRAA